MKSFKQYITEQTEIRRIKPNWTLREKDPKSRLALVKSDKGTFSTRENLDGYMLKRIDAWHNPPTTMDASQFNSWARTLGFHGISKEGNEFALHFTDKSGNKQVASKIQLPGKNTKFIDALHAEAIKPGSPVMRTQISNHHTNNSRNDLVPFVVSEIQNAAVFHGHVPSNVHKYGMSPEELSAEKNQAQKIMSTWKGILDNSISDTDSAEHSKRFYELANEPSTGIRHAASLWTSIHLLHKNLTKTFHPFIQREFPSEKPTPYHYMLRPYSAVQKAHTKFTNHFNQIMTSAKAVGVDVPEEIHTLKKVADDNLSHAESFSGSERQINFTIGNMMRTRSFDIPSDITDKKTIDYLTRMRDKTLS